MMDREAGKRKSCSASNLLQLPNEILCIISNFVSLSGLRKLLLTCRHLNDVALPVYLARHGIHHPEEGMSLFPESLHLLSTLVLARSFPATRSLSCQFGTHSFIKDIQALHFFVSTSPYIEAFTLDFRTVYGTIPTLVGNRLGGRKWLAETLQDIITNVLAAGCESLTILHGLSFAYPRSAVGDFMTRGGLWSTLSRPFSSYLDDATWSSRAPTQKLKMLKVHSTMMLLPPFIDQTMRILGCNPQLAHLSLDSTKLPSENWAKILPYVTLPCLQKFSIAILRYNFDTPTTQQVAVRTVLAFVSRHPSITEFQYLDLCDPTGIDRPKNLLPLLESLDTHPEYITYLLRMPDAFPNLHRVTISLSPIYNNFASLNEALAVIGQRSTDITLCIKLPTLHPGLLSWLSTGLGEVPTNRVECSLRCVKKLELQAHTVARPFIDTAQHAFPAWLSLFPELRYLEIAEYSLPFMTHDAKRSFVQLLSDNCPKLDVVKLELEGHDVRTWLGAQG